MPICLVHLDEDLRLQNTKAFGGRRLRPIFLFQMGGRAAQRRKKPRHGERSVATYLRESRRSMVVQFFYSQTLISDWNGTALALAAMLIESSSGWGKRKEIVLVVGFKLVGVVFFAFNQSKSAVESCDSQKALSCASLANSGGEA